MPHWLWYAYAGVVGACIGSFLNVCISRWPHGLSVISPRSRCPRCEQPISARDNIPFLGWLLLRGRCRNCGEPISVMYPLVELATAALWIASVIHFGPTFAALRVAVLATILLGVAVTDALNYLIPDGFTVSGLVWVVATAVAAIFWGGNSVFATPYDALVGACTGAGAIAIAGWLGELAMKREAMGFGDVTLMAMVGAAVGPSRALLTIFIGAFIGAAAFLLVVYPVSWLRSRRTQTEFAPPLVPFGVFLAPAALAALVWGERFIQWYSGRIGLVQ
jgi:leader peptidase (prepilin peptidase) / N-methyltransferase